MYSTSAGTFPTGLPDRTSRQNFPTRTKRLEIHGNARVAMQQIIPTFPSISAQDISEFNLAISNDEKQYQQSRNLVATILTAGEVTNLTSQGRASGKLLICKASQHFVLRSKEPSSQPAFADFELPGRIQIRKGYVFIIIIKFLDPPPV